MEAKEEATGVENAALTLETQLADAQSDNNRLSQRLEELEELHNQTNDNNVDKLNLQLESTKREIVVLEVHCLWVADAHHTQRRVILIWLLSDR